LKKKTKLFRYSLLFHQVITTIMHGKEILELEDVRQILQNNELMKKTYFIKEAPGPVIKARGGDQSVKNPKEIQWLLAILLATIAENQGTFRKIV